MKPLGQLSQRSIKLKVGIQCFWNDLLAVDKDRRFHCLNFTQDNGFPMADCCLFTYASGNNLGNNHFIWKETLDEDTMHIRSRKITDVQVNLPVYHARHMKSVAHEKLAQICPSVKPYQARATNKLLSGDKYISENKLSKEMDKRVQAVLENADKDVIIVDLHKNSGRPQRFQQFWEIVDRFLEDITAVDDRKHDNISSEGDVITHSKFHVRYVQTGETCRRERVGRQRHFHIFLVSASVLA